MGVLTVQRCLAPPAADGAPLVDEVPTHDRTVRAQRLAKVALVASIASVWTSLLVFPRLVEPRLPVAWSWVVTDVLCGRLYALLVVAVPLYAAHRCNDRLRRLSPGGSLPIGRVCAVLVAAVATTAAPTIWPACRALRDWWVLQAPLEFVPLCAVTATGVAAMAICVIGFVWTLCRLDEMPRTPWFPHPEDE